MVVQSPIARARGLGAAREGSGHWTRQRLTAISNIVLVLWFVFSAMALAGAGYEEVRAWLASPVPASLMILLIISTFYHARLGVQVVIEDYVHHEGAKIASLAAVTLITFGLAVACITAILKVSIES
ncbi:MAG TPA: succinate dehydrogenase, hydrophobic membrane anchor protein [Geminicoccaceae bacterium]|nr:succinate dehydrogenase, hydrophobic membrane anchor protein [Geminicoccaceae bacterium]